MSLNTAGKNALTLKVVKFESDLLKTIDDITPQDRARNVTDICMELAPQYKPV